jgi:hypothetical protein
MAHLLGLAANPHPPRSPNMPSRHYHTGIQAAESLKAGACQVTFSFPSKILPRPFRPAFLSKNTAHFVWEMAHLADNPILICSLRIICDTRNHCVHDFDPTDVGEYM